MPDVPLARAARQRSNAASMAASSRSPSSSDAGSGVSSVAAPASIVGEQGPEAVATDARQLHQQRLTARVELEPHLQLRDLGSAAACLGDPQLLTGNGPRLLCLAPTEPLIDARRLQGPEHLRDLVLLGIRHGQLLTHSPGRIELLAPDADQSLRLAFQLPETALVDADPDLRAPADVVGLVPSPTGGRCCRCVALLLGTQCGLASLERLHLGTRLVAGTGVRGGVLPRQRLRLPG